MTMYASFITLLLAIVSFFLRYFLKKNDEAIKLLNEKTGSQDKRMNEIEKNYIDRFNSVERMINNSQTQLMNSIGEMGTRIEKSISDLRVSQANQEGKIHLLERLEGHVQ